MIELPQEIRDLLVEQLDDFIEEAAEDPDADTLARTLLELIQEVSEEYGLEQADDIVGFLESSGDLEAPLHDLITEALEGEELELLNAEDLVGILEKVCDIEWTEDDDLLGVDELDVDEALAFESELDDDDL